MSKLCTNCFICVAHDRSHHLRHLTEAPTVSRTSLSQEAPRCDDHTDDETIYCVHWYHYGYRLLTITSPHRDRWVGEYDDG